jgi:ketosteroid isomerase-like protein
MLDRSPVEAFDGDAFVARFNEAWNGHRIDGIVEMMTDDVLFEPSFGSEAWGTRVRGKPAVRAFLEAMFQRIPDVRWDELRHFAHPEFVTVEWLTTGAPVDGQPFRVEGCDILTLRDGLIAAKRSYRKARL